MVRWEEKNWKGRTWYSLDLPVIDTSVGKCDSRKKDSEWFARFDEWGSAGPFKTKEEAMRACEDYVRKYLDKMKKDLAKSIEMMMKDK